MEISMVRRKTGWHIECSVMSKKYLGEEIDIHAGGEDLVFPHHENEIAQSECCNGVPFAKYWMHNAFLNIDNRKMSKSLGNFRTVREIGEQYDLQVLRFFMLNAHYRSPLNFSADLMESSKNALERITEAAARLRDRQAAATVQEATEDEKKLMQEEAAFVTKILKNPWMMISIQQMHLQQYLSLLNLQIPMYRKAAQKNLQDIHLKL